MTTDVFLQEEKNLPVITDAALPQEEAKQRPILWQMESLQFWQESTCLESNHGIEWFGPRSASSSIRTLLGQLANLWPSSLIIPVLKGYCEAYVTWL